MHTIPLPKIPGGSAGAVVASRLSEISHWKVLLLEAGPDEPPGASVPSMAASFIGNEEFLILVHTLKVEKKKQLMSAGSEIDWKYKTVNESHACLSSGGSCYWLRGKNLGGTSVHNGMMYLRGHAKDYDDWVKMGNKGWSWKDVSSSAIE